MQSRLDLAQYFNELGFSVGAEVGVADGRYSETLCKAIPSLKLLCVDPWTSYRGNRRGGRRDHQNTNYEIASNRLAPYNTTLVRAKSMEAVIDVPDESLDFVFIDGNHDYQYVLEDIIEWSKKVKKGGIVSGHDYYHFRNSGVIEAVAEYMKTHTVDLQVIGEVRKHNSDDYQTCFWWVKP